MKKTLVALAALAATSAFAQSAVTISGNIDLAYRQIKEEGQTAAAAVTGTSNATSANRKQIGPVGNGAEGWTSSALQIDAIDDIGGGLKGGYSAAMNVSSWGASADNPNQLLGTGRHSYVFLSGNSGEIRAGYQYTLDDQIQGGIGRATPTGNLPGRVHNFSLRQDPNSTASKTASGDQEGKNILTAGQITRSNAIQYNTPVMSGFQGMVQMATLADDKNTGQAFSGKGNATLQAFAGKYTQGPLNLGASYMTVKVDLDTAGSTSTQNKNNQKHVDLAANYDLGKAVVYYNYFARSQNFDTAASGYTAGAYADYLGAFQNILTTGGSVKRDGSDFGVKVPMGAWTLFGTYGKGAYKLSATGATDKQMDLTAQLIGATYDFSKRTSLNVFSGTTKMGAKAEAGLNSDIKKTMSGVGLRVQF